TKVAEATHEPPKADPETLVLRGAPRRVIRFKRQLLIGTVGGGAMMIFAVMAFALPSPSAKSPPEGQGIYNVDRKTTAGALAALPADYAQTAKKATPQLGDPLPGDLGKPILNQERELGISSNGAGYAQNEDANLARAERLRRAQQARQAKEASVFFPLSQ